MDKKATIKRLKENKRYLQKEYNIERLGFFSSFARNEQIEDSDIDILIEVPKEKRVFLNT